VNENELAPANQGDAGELAHAGTEWEQLLDQHQKRMNARAGSCASPALSPEASTKDLLDEKAHALLDRVAKDEVVIFTGAGKGR
jgi:hypothetical protein